MRTRSGGENEKRERDALGNAANGIKKLPSAQPQWIPCSEKMPEVDEDGYSKKVLISCRNSSMIDIAEYRVNGEKGTTFYVGDLVETFEEYGLKVSAWMPLPEPFKGKQK